LRGVGPALAEKLAKLGVTQVQDLLFVLPTRYEDRTQVCELLLDGWRRKAPPRLRAAYDAEHG
jgi:RecG-like helicase